MSKKRVLVVTTISNTINAFLVPHIREQVRKGIEVEICCKIVKPLDRELLDLNVKIHDIPFSRSAFDKSNFFAYQKVKKLISRREYNLIETHTPIASAIVRIATRKMKTKIIYTAHGFHFYKKSPLKTWIFYYPMEKYLARYTDAIVTINQEDYGRSVKFTENFKTKVYKVSGIGVDTSYKKIPNSKREKLIQELEIENRRTLIYVAELSKRKNQMQIIKLMERLKNSNLTLLLVGSGPLKEAYLEYINDHSLNDVIKLVGFRNDIHDLLQVSDVLVSTSRQEGLPVNVMEGMAHGLPIVASNIRGHNDLLNKYNNGFLFESDDELFECTKQALDREKIDYDMSEYSIFNSINNYNEIYEDVMEKL